MEFYPVGTLLRVTRVDPNDEAYVGQEFVVDDYISAEKSEDGVAFYWGSTPPSSGNVAVPADAVMLVKTAAQMAARKPPTPQEVIEQLDLLGDYRTFRTTESDPDGDGSREVFGKTHDGLPFAFRITVESVWEADE